MPTVSAARIKHPSPPSGVLRTGGYYPIITIREANINTIWPIDGSNVCNRHSGGRFRAECAGDHPVREQDTCTAPC